eukprot:gene2425-1528_t
MINSVVTGIWYLLDFGLFEVLITGLDIFIGVAFVLLDSEVLLGVGFLGFVSQGGFVLSVVECDAVGGLRVCGWHLGGVVKFSFSLLVVLNSSGEVWHRLGNALNWLKLLLSFVDLLPFGLVQIAMSLLCLRLVYVLLKALQCVVVSVLGLTHISIYKCSIYNLRVVGFMSPCMFQGCYVWVPSLVDDLLFLVFALNWVVETIFLLILISKLTVMVVRCSIRCPDAMWSFAFDGWFFVSDYMFEFKVCCCVSFNREFSIETTVDGRRIGSLLFRVKIDGFVSLFVLDVCNMVCWLDEGCELRCTYNLNSVCCLFDMMALQTLLWICCGFVVLLSCHVSNLLELLVHYDYVHGFVGWLCVTVLFVDRVCFLGKRMLHDGLFMFGFVPYVIAYVLVIGCWQVVYFLCYLDGLFYCDFEFWLMGLMVCYLDKVIYSYFIRILVCC